MELPRALQADAEELSSITGCEVRLDASDGRIFVVVTGVRLPAGTYVRDRSDVLLLTDFQYPMSAMDMFYMEPEVQPCAGPVPEHASAIEHYLGRPWRRWSWHRNGIWKPGTDSVLSHWAFVEDCWAKERPR